MLVDVYFFEKLFTFEFVEIFMRLSYINIRLFHSSSVVEQAETGILG